MNESISTYLMIKRHQDTGLMYFCKTATRDPLKYHGSGKYWKKHLKLHGTNVDTLWYQYFTDKDDLVEFALFFSEIYNIVSATHCGKKIWANEVPEDGLQGGQNRGMVSPLKGIKQPHVSTALTGRKRPNHSKLLTGRKQSEEHIRNRADSLRGKSKTKEHGENISNAKKGILNPKVSMALKGKIGTNKGKKLKTYSCKHCGIETTGGNLKRWHDDNCKHKGIKHG
jgi:hypothetical protein